MSIFAFGTTVKSEDVETRIKIAVIDTGVHRIMAKEKFMCKDKPVSFADGNPYDYHGHGTNIIGTIGQSINPETHCIVSIDFYSGNSKTDTKATLDALKYVLTDPAIRYVNMSLGGPGFSNTEKNLIQRILVRGIVLTVAAGNDSSNLDSPNYEYYPALYRKTLKYPNFHVVRSKLPSSNYGSVVTATMSGDIKPNFFYARRMQGTSQASAQYMAKLIKDVVLYSTGEHNGQQKSDRRRKYYR